MVQHLTYPSMERQDLTQGQLGHFKFTPVDDTGPPPSQYFIPYSYPPLQQYSDRSLQDSGSHEQEILNPLYENADIDSFNVHFKPSLDDARLTHGPAALRAVVNSATPSPKKRFLQASADKIMRPSATTFQPVSFLPEQNGHSPYLAPESLNEITNDTYYDAKVDAHFSLIEALSNEQQAHYNTKNALENEQSQRLAVDAECKRLVDHNKSLLNSIRLLQSTIKHMVQKEEQSENTTREFVVNEPQVEDTSKEESPVEEQPAKQPLVESPHASNYYDMDRAVEDFKREAERRRVPNSLLHDPFAQPREINGKQTPTSDPDSHGRLFNLDLLKKPDEADNSEEAQRQRTLRKQFATMTTTDSNEDNVPSKRDIAVSSTDASLMNPITRCELESLQPLFPKYTNDDEIQHIASVFEFPQSFLDKYSKRSAAQLSSDVSDEDTDMETLVRKTMTWNLKSPARARAVLDMPQPLPIDWKLRKEELDDFLNAPRSFLPHGKESYYFKHPLRFLPRLTERNIFRTIMVDFLPLGTTYADVLSKVRGGRIESVQLFPPVTNIANFMTARIVFTHEGSAVSLFKRPGLVIKGRKARVWHVQEPTYPRNELLEQFIYEDNYTRLLVVESQDPDIQNKLQRKLKHQSRGGFILDFGHSHDLVPLVEFTSIEEAAKALRLLQSDPELRSAQFDFETDYCDEQWSDEE